MLDSLEFSLLLIPGLRSHIRALLGTYATSVVIACNTRSGGRTIAAASLLQVGTVGVGR